MPSPDGLRVEILEHVGGPSPRFTALLLSGSWPLILCGHLHRWRDAAEECGESLPKRWRREVAKAAREEGAQRG